MELIVLVFELHTLFKNLNAFIVEYFFQREAGCPSLQKNLTGLSLLKVVNYFREG